jgi:predicted transcriptional regulator
VRTTLTLDDDLATRLQREARRTGKPFKHLVNDCLRAGLSQVRQSDKSPPFVLQTHQLGALRPGLSLDKISQLLQDIEGPIDR